MFGLAGWSAAYAIQVVGSKHGVVLFCFYEIYFIANKSVLDQKIIYWNQRSMPNQMMYNLLNRNFFRNPDGG